MGQAIEKSVNQFAVDVAKIWEDKKQIRELFAPDLTQKEFDLFVGLGMSLGANPFNREIWAVKYDKSKPAQIFTGRDFNRKKAQAQPDYNGHTAIPVYENDDYHFDVASGMPVHVQAKRDERGKLVGAYGLAWRKGIDRPFYVFVEFAEYNKGFSLWKDSEKPATMITKVAEDQVLRMAWQAVFSGTYGEAEQWQVEKESVEKYRQPIPKKTDDIVEAEAVEDPVSALDILANELTLEFEEKKDRVNFVKSCCGKDNWKDLTEDDAIKAMGALEKRRAGR